MREQYSWVGAIFQINNPTRKRIVSSLEESSTDSIERSHLVYIAQSVRGCLTNRENNETAAIQKKNEPQIAKKWLN